MPVPIMGVRQLHASNPSSSAAWRWVSWCGIAGMAPLVSGIVSEARSTPEWRNCTIFAPRPLLQPMARLTWLWPSKRACGPVAREVQIVCKITKLVPNLSKFG